MLYLKADTAVEVLIGPVVAVGDGFTPVTTMTIGAADEAELIKHNGSTALAATAIGGTVAAITNADGYYTLDLSTTDTNTEGFLVILINDDSLMLPIRHEFMVVNANVYDSLFAVAGTDLLQTDVQEIDGGTVPAPAVTGVPDVNVTHQRDGAIPPTAVTGVPDVNATHIADTAASLTGGDLDVNVAAMAANVLTAAAINAAALNGKGDWNIGKTGYALTTAEHDAIVDKVWDEVASGHLTAGTFGLILQGLRANTATAGAGSTITLDGGAPTTVDLFKGSHIAIVNGTGVGQSRLITAYSAGRVATITPNWVTNPASGSEFVIIPGAVVDVARWLDSVVNALISGRVDANAQAGIAPLGTAMRGTDSGALASVCSETRLSELDAGTGGKAANQIDLIKTEADKIAAADAGAGVAGSVIEEVENRATPAQVATELATYDGPTRAEATSDKDEIITDLDDVKGTGFVKDTDSLVDIRPETDKIALADAGAGVTGSVIEEVENRTTPADLGVPQINTALNNIEFLFVSSGDHVTPVTGAGTMAVTRSIDGGAFGSGTGTGPAEVGNGIYQYDASAADMNGGIVTFRFTATTGTPVAPDDVFITIKTRA